MITQSYGIFCLWIFYFCPRKSYYFKKVQPCLPLCYRYIDLNWQKHNQNPAHANQLSETGFINAKYSTVRTITLSMVEEPKLSDSMFYISLRVNSYNWFWWTRHMYRPVIWQHFTLPFVVYKCSDNMMYTYMHHRAIYHFVLGYGTASYWELVGAILCDCDSFLVFCSFWVE